MESWRSADADDRKLVGSASRGGARARGVLGVARARRSRTTGAMLEQYCTECHNDAEAGRRAVARGRDARRRRGATREVGSTSSASCAAASCRRPAARARAPSRSTSSSRRSRRVSTRPPQRAAPTPGRVALHRLNRTEYATAVEDLLGVRRRRDARCCRPTSRATASTTSPKCCACRRRISISTSPRRATSACDAVGSPAASADARGLSHRSANHTAHVDGLPLGTRDGLVVEHYFPADGEYVFNLNVSSTPGAELRAYPNGWLEYRAHASILTIDGAKVFEGKLGGEEDLRDARSGADHRGQRDQGPLPQHPRAREGGRPQGRRDVRRAQPRRVRLPACSRSCPAKACPTCRACSACEVVGPYDADRHQRAARASRERIFICYPADASGGAAVRRARFSRNLARSAFRRPVTDDGHRAAARVLSRRARARAASRPASRKALTGDSRRARSSCIARSPAVRRRSVAAGQRVRDHGSRARVAALVLPLEPGPRRGAARARREQARCSEPDVYEQQVRAHARRPALAARSSRTSRSSGSACAARGHRSRSEAVSEFRRGSARAPSQREMELFLDSILRDETRSVRRSADGAAHVRQRAARASLRHRRACAAISSAASSSTTRTASVCSARAAC